MLDLHGHHWIYYLYWRPLVSTSKWTVDYFQQGTYSKLGVTILFNLSRALKECYDTSFFRIKGHVALDRIPGPGYNALFSRLIPINILSACPHRHFHILPGRPYPKNAGRQFLPFSWSLI